MTANVVRARGKPVRGSIRTSVPASAESPLDEPSYATAGMVNVPGTVAKRSTRPPTRAVRATIVSPAPRRVTYRTGAVRAATPCCADVDAEDGQPVAGRGGGDRACRDERGAEDESLDEHVHARSTAGRRIGVPG